MARLAVLSPDSPLARAGLLLTLANVATGLLGYVYQVLMGRMLAPTQFALFSTVMALIMLIGSPLNAMLMIISRRVSTLRAQGRVSAVSPLYWRSHAHALIAALLIVSMLWAIEGQIQVGLKSPTTAVVWILAAISVFMALFIINNAFFQGEQHFGLLAGASILLALLKILFGVLGIMFGYGVEGALIGLMLACAVPWLIGVAFNLCRFSKVATQTQLGNGDRLQIRDVWPVLLANVAFAAMTQLDMVLVNWYFTPEDAGLYAAASVLGKAVLYLPGGLVLALFPLVAENHAKDRSSAYMLQQAIALTALLCGAVAIAYWFLGEWFVNLLYGAKYSGAGQLLRWYGFAMLPMALVMVVEYFLIAKGRILFVWLFLAMSPLQIMAIKYWHESLMAIVLNIGICGVILAVVGYVILLVEYRRGE